MDVTSAPLVFGSIPLARRIEAAEVRLMRAFGAAAVALAHPGAFVEPFAGGLSVSGGPASPISKVLATGFAGVPSEAEFDDLEATYADAGCRCRVHRLAAANTAGCDLAVVTTEPGSRSHANAQRHGFTPLYSRLVLSRHVP